MNPTCNTCKYWEGDKDTETADCRRFPPPEHRHIPGGPIVGRWVMTHKSDWCGEHKPQTKRRPNK